MVLNMENAILNYFYFMKSSNFSIKESQTPTVFTSGFQNFQMETQLMLSGIIKASQTRPYI